MKHFHNITQRLVAMVALITMASACTVYNFYKFNGASLDYNVYKTVSISDFPIRAALVYPPLQQTFENKLTDMVAQNTRFLAHQCNGLVEFCRRNQTRIVGTRHEQHR